MRVVVKLILFALEFKTKSILIATNDGSFPRQELDVFIQPENLARKVFTRITSIDSNWAQLQFRLIDCIVHDKELNIIYGCIIPENIKLNEHYSFEPIDITKYINGWEKIIEKASRMVTL